jgi:glycerophosphoryl diester phosphodiesterase
MACGADGVELDVWARSDDVLVVTHNWTDGPLLTLDEVLAIDAPEGFWFDIEAKSAPGLAPQAEHYADLLSDTLQGVGRRIMVRSFDHAILRAFHAIEPEAQLAALIDYDSDAWVFIALAAGGGIISPHYSTVTVDRVSDAHDAGIGVSVWTVNDPADWERMAVLGVDTMITDDPCSAVRHFKKGTG